MKANQILKIMGLLLVAFFGPTFLLAQSETSKLSYGVKFRYSDEMNVVVESGSDPFGKPIFSLAIEGPSGRTPITSLTPPEKAKIQRLMHSIQLLSFSLPYKEQVLQIHGEAVTIEINALSYQLTYTDSYDRARKQRPIKALVDLLKPLGSIKAVKQ